MLTPAASWGLRSDHLRSGRAIILSIATAFRLMELFAISDRISRQAQDAGAGRTRCSVCDDKGIVTDMPAWCESTGHEFLGVEEKDREYRAYVKKRVEQ